MTNSDVELSVNRWRAMMMGSHDGRDESSHEWTGPVSCPSRHTHRIKNGVLPWFVSRVCLCVSLCVCVCPVL